MMKPEHADGLTRFLGKLLRAEMRFTVMPAVLLPSAAVVLMAIFPGGAIALLYVFFFYLLPASLIANGLGYRTVVGAPPLPLPASSVTQLVVLLAFHATLVALLFLVWHAFAATMRWARRKGSG